MLRAWADPPKALQRLLRHSTITLTLDTYAHLLPSEEVETVGRMAGFEEDNTQAATGTMDPPAKNVCNAVRNAGTTPDDPTHKQMAQHEIGNQPDVLATITNAGVSAACDGPVPLSAATHASTGERIRTPNLLIRSQVLYPVELRPQSQPVG